MYNCEICNKPVPDYKPEYCCPGTAAYECGCGGRPTNPCICSDKCWDVLMNGSGESIEQRRIDAGIERYTWNVIDRFEDDNFFLSNFYRHPISYEGHDYLTTEHAYQALKTLDPIERDMVINLPTPGKAKRAGMKVPLRPDWERVKNRIMEDVLRIKFADPVLRQKLMDTKGKILIEGTVWHDNYWGNCDKCKDIEGVNMLGKLLMKIRDE